ncbi:conserved unknown protein [Ectocarpus siliculosus]|uniref:TRUD domain-containing protein n=1 Tax=Ectocarpus siliculosus TaxID=2880 RepID=D8LTL8_ECTSI|nr:conserved unknown protein [Ectocarpus siliculosus]|eukprot:CBN73915.1 conserved unknown protein [Ectocarpus siliculosus]
MTSSSSLNVIGIEDDMFMGEAPGFGGCIKQVAADFLVNEIDSSGRLVEASSLTLPPAPPAPVSASGRPIPSTAAGNTMEQQSNRSKSGDHGAGSCTRVGQAEDDSELDWAQELRRCLAGSESDFSRLARLDAAARGASAPAQTAPSPTPVPAVAGMGSAEKNEGMTLAGDVTGQETGASEAREQQLAEAEKGETDGAVLVWVHAGQGADKAARARVHRAVQETFPFIKTTTEKAPDGSVTVVCTQASPLPALRGLLSGPDLEALQRLVNRGPSGKGADSGVTLSSDMDRANRTLVHRAISEAFPYLQTKTCNDPKDPSSQRVSVFWSKRRGGGGGRKRKRQGFDSHGGNDSGRKCGGANEGSGTRWVRFGLRKEGREHHVTALALSKALRVPLSALSFGGIKDKRAITTQACIVKGVPPRKILEINGSIPGVTVGNLSYCARGLNLGELSGNKFSVVVRGVMVPGAAVKSSLEEACSNGFINFYGTQRVGSPLAAARGQPLPYQIGRHVLAGDWEAAVKKILQPRDNDPPFLHSALAEFFEGKITAKDCAARVRGRNRLSTERLVLQGLVRYGASAFQAAIQCVPFGMRTMWVHAYQSHVWNSLACARIRLLGSEAVPGDLVLPADVCTATEEIGEMSPAFTGAVSAGTEDSLPSSCAARAPAAREDGETEETCPGRHVNGLLSSTTAAVGDGAKGSGHEAGDGHTGRESAGSSSVASGRGRGLVTALTSETIQAFASEGVTPRDLLRRVVLPLAGTSIQYPLHQIGSMYRQRLQEDGVDPLMWPAPTPPFKTHFPRLPDGTTRATAIDAAGLTASQAPLTGAPCLSRGIGGDVGGRDSTAAETVTVATEEAVASSTLVPRGAYRRLLCVPVDSSWEAVAPLTKADDPEEVRIKRSSMSGRGQPNGTTPPGDAATAPGDKGRVPLKDGHSDGSQVSGDGGQSGGFAKDRGGADLKAASANDVLTDVRLTFTLPPGSFATMCLREVMKRNDDVGWGSRGAMEEPQEEGGVADTIAVDRTL